MHDNFGMMTSCAWSSTFKKTGWPRTDSNARSGAMPYGTNPSFSTAIVLVGLKTPLFSSVAIGASESTLGAMK